MTTSMATDAVRHPAPGSSVVLSSAGWRRLRRTLTIGLFAVATTAGTVVGLGGADVSPVAPAAATDAVAPVADRPVLHQHHHHR